MYYKTFSGRDTMITQATMWPTTMNLTWIKARSQSYRVPTYYS